MKRAISLLCMFVAAAVLATGCTSLSVPTHPFDHELVDESSVAVPVSDRGEVALVVSRLEESGFFCAQVRANSDAAQVWCRASEDPVGNEVDRSATSVNIVTTRDGVIQYADISAKRGGRDGDWDRLREVLDASFLALWHSDAAKVHKVITEVVRGPRFFPDDPHPPVIKEFSTTNASYLVAEGGLVPKFRLVTSAVQDRSWPYAANDYATTMKVAGPELELSGYKCSTHWSSPCRMGGGQSSNQEISFTTPNPNLSLDDPDQILTVDMFNPGTTDDADLESLSSIGFPQELPFLVPAARGPVEAQIVATQRTGEPFIGIVAGTILIVEPPINLPRVRTGPLPVNVRIGVAPISIVE
ncbi:hypothetical protein ABIB48_000466 [Arthrobacter sp. UYCu511]